jgi:hypothetical protein
LTADFSVYLTGPADFDRGLCRLPDLDTLIFAFEMGLTTGVNVRNCSHLQYGYCKPKYCLNCVIDFKIIGSEIFMVFFNFFILFF